MNRLHHTLLAALALMATRPDGLGAPREASPLPVSGIAGATFFTAEPGALRRFYGQGAGFAEVPSAPDTLRFRIGEAQWLEFQIVAKADWTRRLRWVTLYTPSLGEVRKELAARSVAATWAGSDPASGFLGIQDPAGNRIHFQETPPSGKATSVSAAAFSDHLQHFGLAVARSASEATIAFYRDTLGWPEALRMKGPDGRLNMVKFRLPGRGDELVELILVDPPLNKWAAGAFDHVNFEVRNIDAAYKVLYRGGIASRAKDRPTVNGERLWAINLFDPELTRIEIMSLVPTSAAIGTVSEASGN